ncbi:uncharacterized protein LOC132748359 [Ruditapes philippinarum]|uniref:uncharacterized protein LOC132748359 n=1 Tax=Ruditapes philippinarum TaxID=129788 RepID=UPI00295B69FA|nr:uncharacterized protein LOC132748359 [Ruditapes philippinarum]
MPYKNVVAQYEPLEDKGEFKLRKTVFLGYTDVAAGGIRALLGINMKKEFLTIDIPELGDVKLAVESTEKLDPRDQPYAPFQIWNLKYELFSVILVNTKLKADKCHYVCSKIMDLCTRWCVDKLVVLSALRLDVSMDNISDIYETVINDMPLTKCPELSGDTRMNDPFLSTLIQMVQVEYIPTCFLLIPAHRACLGEARETDGSKQVIKTFQQTINTATKISFDQEFSNNLIYKGDNDQKDSNSVSMIYS